MTSTTLLATTGSTIARAIRSADGGWTVDRPAVDARVRCMSADPATPTVLYAGTQQQGVVRSDDGGATWQPSGLHGATVTALAVSRAEPGVVYAGTKTPRLYVSRDRGAHWEELDAFRRAVRWWWFSPAEPPYRSYVQGIALSPTDPRVIVAGIEVGAVVRSADGGRSWSGHRPGALRDCHTLAWHASDGRWVYEGGGMGGGAAYSRDAGVSWTHARRGLDGYYGWAVAADPERPDVWYLSAAPSPQTAHRAGNAQAQIYRSVGGTAWRKLAGGLPEPIPHMPYALVIDPRAPGHLYAGLSNGDVWHTADYGTVWQRLPFTLGSIRRTLVLLGR